MRRLTAAFALTALGCGDEIERVEWSSAAAAVVVLNPDLEVVDARFALRGDTALVVPSAEGSFVAVSELSESTLTDRSGRALTPQELATFRYGLEPDMAELAPCGDSIDLPGQLRISAGYLSKVPRMAEIRVFQVQAGALVELEDGDTWVRSQTRIAWPGACP